MSHKHKHNFEKYSANKKVSCRRTWKHIRTHAEKGLTTLMHDVNKLGHEEKAESLPGVNKEE